MSSVLQRNAALKWSFCCCQRPSSRLSFPDSLTASAFRLQSRLLHVKTDALRNLPHAARVSYLATATKEKTNGSGRWGARGNILSAAAFAGVGATMVGMHVSNSNEQTLDKRFPWQITISSTLCEGGAAEEIVSKNETEDKISAATKEGDSGNDEQKQTERDSGNVEQKGEEEEEDPYANLPEEDEPTECSMCNTFRQGPCRPFWRKLEHCFKDNENAEGGAANCVRYFTPHQTCLMEYMNLYLLIGHEMKQEIAEDAEMAFPEPEHRRAIEMPEIDWSPWKSFVEEQGPTFCQTIPGLPKDTPLWKRLPENTEPILITLNTSVPHQCKEKEGLILKAAYVLDQDGKLLGFTYNDVYGDLLKESKGEEIPDEEKALPKERVEVDFVLLPGETHKIQLKAYYAENPVHADPEKEILDGLLCETSHVAVVSS